MLMVSLSHALMCTAPSYPTQPAVLLVHFCAPVFPPSSMQHLTPSLFHVVPTLAHAVPLTQPPHPAALTTCIQVRDFQLPASFPVHLSCGKRAESILNDNLMAVLHNSSTAVLKCP